jgi:hypothetical protein
MSVVGAFLICNGTGRSPSDLTVAIALSIATIDELLFGEVAR